MVYSALVSEVFIFYAIAENRGKIISMQRCTQEYGYVFDGSKVLFTQASKSCGKLTTMIAVSKVPVLFLGMGAIFRDYKPLTN